MRPKENRIIKSAIEVMAEARVYLRSLDTKQLTKIFKESKSSEESEEKFEDTRFNKICAILEHPNLDSETMATILLNEEIERRLEEV